MIERQNDAKGIYAERKIDGWKLQTVGTDGRYNSAILMDRAPGKTARKIYESNPAMYRETLRLVYDYEHDLMFKPWVEGEVRLANPDFHDGQVLVDAESKTITVIDFGQAVRLNQRDRELAFDIVSAMQGLKTRSSTLKMLQAWSQSVGGQTITDADLTMFLKVKDPMDRFVRLISMMANRKADIPLSSIHLVLAVNRLVKLGEKVGRHPTVSIGKYLAMREVRGFFGGQSAAPIAKVVAPAPIVVAPVATKLPEPFSPARAAACRAIFAN